MSFITGKASGISILRTLALASSCLASPALAETANVPVNVQPGAPASDNQVQEIVVSAQRRTEPLQKVPISVQAVTGDTITK